MNDTLKHAEIYYLNGVPYMKLVYEYTDDKGTHKVTIPRLDFPYELTRIPTIHTEIFGSNFFDSIRTISLDSDVVLWPHTVDTKEGPVTDVRYFDELIIPKVHEITLDEIEKKLGYPIKIISNKEKNK